MERRLISVHNPHVRQWSELSTRKGRDKQGRFLVEGGRLVEEALQSDFAVEAVIYDEGRPLPERIRRLAADKAGLAMIAASAQVLEKITDTVSPQGIAAVVAKRVWTLDAVVRSGWSLVLVLDGVQDPGNLGTLVRSADAVVADAVVAGKGSVDIYNPKAVRSTMGSLFHLPVVECGLDQLLPLLHADSSLQIVSASLQATESCYELDLRRPTWIVLGNEAGGISQAAAGHVQKHVKIPMPGRAESLNVAMAGTVLLFEALRQRMSRK